MQLSMYVCDVVVIVTVIISGRAIKRSNCRRKQAMLCVP